MIICFVGRSKSGKTSIITRIIPILRSKGLKIAVIKHAHKDFEIDKPGKDSWKFFESGADVLISSPSKLALIKRVSSDDLYEVCKYFSDYDIILVEGYKKTCKRKILVAKNINEVKDIGIDPNTVAVVCDEDFGDLNFRDTEIKMFKRSEVEKIAEFIYSLFKRKIIY